MKYSYMVSDRTVTVTFENGLTKAIEISHPQVGVILDALRDRASSEDVLTAFSRIESMRRYLGGFVEVDAEERLLYKGRVIENSVCDRIIEFMKAGLPFEPLVAFLEKLLMNPSMRSVSSLYNFLRNQDITIDSEGYLMCYKAVTKDYLDKYTETISNAVGALVTMPRNEIDDNPGSYCSRGLHAGSIKYVRGYASREAGDRILLVKIHPGDVVSVPLDVNAQKMRTCAYQVLADVTDQMIEDVAPSPLFGAPEAEEDDNPGPFCPKCGEDLGENGDSSITDEGTCANCGRLIEASSLGESKDGEVAVVGRAGLTATVHVDDNGRYIVTVTDE